MTGVRVHEGAVEGFCERCRTWWPVDPADLTDYWMPARGYRRCRACHLETMAAASRDYRRRRDDETPEPRRSPVPSAVRARRAYKREWMRRHRAQKRAAA